MIKINNCKFENCGTAISTSSDVELEVTETEIIKCDNGIEIRDVIEIKKILGLREEVDVEEIKELLKEVLISNKDKKSIEKVIKKSNILKFLLETKTILSLVDILYKMKDTSMIQKLIELIG